ncbi:MAG: hypothetical protein PHD67_00865 [Oscillospiraceae bacterium]|nr:hypothetical protein [Oscillospiraceae bacterium]
MKKLLESKQTKIVLVAVMLASLLLTIIAVTLPLARRAEKIDLLGANALSTGESVAISVGHYSGAQIKALAANPQESATYGDLCDLLTKLKGHYGLKDLYTVNKGLGGAYFYLLDANYRSNATPGTDYKEVGSPMDAAGMSRDLKTLLDKIDSGALPSGYTKNIVKEGAGGYIVVAIPVADRSGETVTILCMNVALDNVEFNQFYFIDLNYVAWFFGALSVLSLGALLLLRRRAAKAKQQEMEEEE